MAQAIPIQVTQTGFTQSIQAGAKAAGQINIPVNATFNAGSFNNLSQPLGKVTGLATEFEKSIAASNARVIAFGASVGIINGIQNAFKDLVTTTIEVQKNLTLIGAISNKSGQELEKFGDNLFEIAKNTGQSFKTAAEAATEFARQGLSVEQTLKRTSDALTLTRFTSLSAADSVEVLTAAVNSFGGAGITTTEILNKLVAVDSKFAVSAADLANGLSRTGSVAEEVGVSLDQLNGIITSVQEKTARGGAVIGNAFKTIFTNIRSEAAIKALENIGIYSKDAEGNLKPVIPILQELGAKLNSLSGIKKIEVLESIASKYNINVLSALLSDINNAGGTYQKSTAASAGATNEAYSRQLELNKALSVAINNVFVSSEKLANSIGKIGVTDNLKGLLDFFSNFINSITDVIDSEGVGGKIAKGLISGLGGIFFKVGIPVLTGLFIILTKNILQFGAESLQTILGLNSKVKERQALEQAVFNTLVQNEGIMANIAALAGDRVKQEQFLLSVYNQQLAAIQKVRDIATVVAPGLQAGGLSATTGQITKRSAGGYLPAQEAADVRRGVGGASSSSQVVSIPNFAFGGGKKGTMIANTSEYIVPNFANGGSAIFNQDMISSFGLPAGARKLSAAGGYIPNFAKYIYDSDRIPADKNATLKAILASPAKKNLIIGPAGSGKSTLAAGMGTFLTGAADVANATEIDILSAAGRTKDGGLSKNLESIMAAVNGTGGKVSYLYTKNFDILSRRGGRTDPSEGDLRSKKQIAGTAYAPLNQFDFMGMVKSKAKSFDMIRAAGGFIPNFAEEQQDLIKESTKYAGLFAQEKLPGEPNQIAVVNPATGKASLSDGPRNDKDGVKLIVRGYPARSNAKKGDVNKIKEEVEKVGEDLAEQYAASFAAAFNPDLSIKSERVREQARTANKNNGAVQGFVGSIFESGIAGILNSDSFTKSQGRSVTSPFDFEATAEIKKAFGISESVNFIEAKNQDNESNRKKIAEKIYRVEKYKLSALKERGFEYLDTPDGKKRKAKAFRGTDLDTGESVIKIEQSFGRYKNFPLGTDVRRYNFVKKAPMADIMMAGANGYIPNFADPLKDAVQREMQAGLDPAQIRITKDARLKNAQNPSGFAVINTRDEPDGKIPNFAAGDAKLDLPRLSGESKSEAADVRKVLNEQAAKIIKANGTLEEYDKAVKTVLEKLKQNAVAQEEVKKATDAQRSQIQSVVKSTPTAGGAAGGAAGGKSGPADKKEFDIGKFLIFQTAMAGATSAAQTFTKEGSTAAAGMETVSAGINILGTAAMVATTAMGPMGKLLTITATVVSALIPVFSKWSDALETDGDRAVKSLAALSDQAKKTGESITPEILLANLNKKLEENNQGNKEKNITSQIQDYASNNFVKGESLFSFSSGVSSGQEKSISAILQGIGGVDESGKINEEILKKLIDSSTVKKGVFKEIDNNALISSARTLALTAAKENVGKIETRKGPEKEKSAAIEYENSLLTVQQQILKNIFDANIKSTNAYEKNLLAIEAQNAALERGKSIILEQQMFSLQKTQEETKAEAEATKAKAENLNKLREKLTSIQGTTGQAFAGISDENLQKLIDAAKGGTATKEFSDAFLSVQNTEGKDLVTLDQSVQSKELKTAAFASAQDQQNIDNNLNNQKTAIAQKYALSQTTLEKNNQEMFLLNAIISGYSVILDDLSSEFDGSAKYEQLLNNQTSEYGKSLAELILKNKLSADGAEEKLKTDISAAQNSKQSEQRARENTTLIQRANLTQINLDKELNKKLDDMDQEGVNASNKIQADARLLDAETNLINKYNQAYKDTDQTVEVDKKIANIKAKNVKSQRDLDIEQSVQLKMIRDNINIDQAALKRKRELLEAQTKELSTKDYENQITEELNIEKEQLIQAIRKSIVGYGNPQALKNLELKQKEQDIKSVDETIQKGKLYNGSNAFLQEQAIGRVLEQNIQKAGGKKAFSNLSSGERSNIISGKNNTIKQNLDIQGSGLLAEAKTFQQILGQDTPKALADGLAEAMKVGLSGADNIGEALQNVAKSFLQTIQSAMLESASKNIVGSFTSAIGGSQGGYVKKFATGGMVTGGSGIRDDVPAMLSAGEYVMRKSAVQKYGAENIAKMNDGGIFLPGVRGGSAISGYDQLSKFANQTTTSGATDVLKGTGSTAYANLEDQSARLSRFGLMNEDTIKGEITSAQQQGLDIIAKREAYRTQQRKAMQQQIISTVASIAIAYGAGKLGSAMKTKATTKLNYGENNLLGGGERLNNTVLNNMGAANAIPNDKFESLYFNSAPRIGVGNAIGYRGAYGGMIRGFANGGGPTDDIPALLMGGEYVMNRATTRKYGKQYLDSMNTGRARFADGGEVSGGATVESSDSKAKVDSKTGTAVNININVSGSGSSTESQGQTSQGGVDYKKMGERIKAVVLETINEEKRLGGALRSR